MYVLVYALFLKTYSFLYFDIYVTLDIYISAKYENIGENVSLNYMWEKLG